MLHICHPRRVDAGSTRTRTRTTHTGAATEVCQTGRVDTRASPRRRHGACTHVRPQGGVVVNRRLMCFVSWRRRPTRPTIRTTTAAEATRRRVHHGAEVERIERIERARASRRSRRRTWAFGRRRRMRRMRLVGIVIIRVECVRIDKVVGHAESGSRSASTLVVRALSMQAFTFTTPQRRSALLALVT